MNERLFEKLEWPRKELERQLEESERSRMEFERHFEGVASDRESEAIGGVGAASDGERAVAHVDFADFEDVRELQSAEGSWLLC